MNEYLTDLCHSSIKNIFKYFSFKYFLKRVNKNHLHSFLTH